MFEIEKGIPVPVVKRGGPGRPSIFPLEQMQVGDSFLATTNLSSLKPALWKYSKKTGVKFQSKGVPGEGIRVWRIA